MPYWKLPEMLIHIFKYHAKLWFQEKTITNEITFVEETEVQLFWRIFVLSRYYLVALRIFFFFKLLLLIQKN